MRHLQLGRTGLFVSELCLGTMTFGGSAACGADRRARPGATPTASSAVRSTPGINFIDTADVYSEGQSEEITGQALKNLGSRARTS